MPAHSCISPGKPATQAALTYGWGVRIGSRIGATRPGPAGVFAPPPFPVPVPASVHPSRCRCRCHRIPFRYPCRCPFRSRLCRCPCRRCRGRSAAAGPGVGRGSAGARIRRLLPRRSPSGRGPARARGSREQARVPGPRRRRLGCRGGLLRRGRRRPRLPGRLPVAERPQAVAKPPAAAAGTPRSPPGAGACAGASAAGADASGAGADAGDGTMLDEVPAGTVEVSRVIAVRPNTTAPITTAAAASPTNTTGPRRRVDGPSSHSSWVKFSSGRLSAGPRLVGVARTDDSGSRASSGSSSTSDHASAPMAVGRPAGAERRGRDGGRDRSRRGECGRRLHDLAALRRSARPLPRR